MNGFNSHPSKWNYQKPSEEMQMQDPNSVFYKSVMGAIDRLIADNDVLKDKCIANQVHHEQIEKAILIELEKYEREIEEEKRNLILENVLFLRRLQKQIAELHQQAKQIAARMKEIAEQVEELSKKLEILQNELKEEYAQMTRHPDEIFKEFLASDRYQEIVDELGPKWQEDGIDIDKVLKRLAEECENNQGIPDDAYFKSKLENFILDEYVQNERARTGQYEISDEKLITFRAQASSKADELDQKAKLTETLKERNAISREKIQTFKNEVSKCENEMSQYQAKANDLSSSSRNVEERLNQFKNLHNPEETHHNGRGFRR